MSISAPASSERPSFVDCLLLVEQIDKFCGQQKLPANFDALSESAKSKIKERIEKSKIEAEAKESELLAKFDVSSKEYALLVDILKNVKIRHGILEKTEEFQRISSQYGQYFNQEVYHEILPYCQLAYLYEQNGIAEEHAEKLSVLFDSVKDIVEYLLIQSKQNKKESLGNLVHDACLFELRDLSGISEESWKKWKSLVKNDKGNTVFIMEVLPNAKIIEDLVVSNYSSAKKPQEVAKATAELIRKIGEVNQMVKKLSSKAAELYEDEEKVLESARQELSDLKLELFEACKGLSLKDLNIIYLVAFNQKVLKNLGSFSYLVAKIGEQNYHRFKKLKRQYEGTNDTEIPNIIIDGKDLTPPAEGAYLMKVPVQDELQAARAACLGKLTNCCQSLSGEAGDPCVVHGLTSQYGGFYVVCKGDPNNPKVEDYLLGQCWAWRSKNDAIVFDSIEVANKHDEFNRECVINFFEKLAAMMVEKDLTHKVVCGGSSGISKYIGTETILNRAEFFKEGDYCRYSDARFQRVLQDKNAPFYFFSTDEACKQKTIELAEKAMKTGCPLVESDYMIQLLNYIVLEISDRTKPKDYFDRKDRLQNEVFLKSALALREEILNFSEKFDRKNEVLNILSGMEQYLELTDENIDSILEKIKSKTFSTKTVNRDKESILLALLKKEPMTDSIKEKIYYLIDNADVDVNHPDNDGLTPFMRAAQLKDFDLCKKLKEKGAEVNAVDRDREGVLFAAYHSFTHVGLDGFKTIEKEELDFLLKLIMEFKININSVDRNGETLLMKFSSVGNLSFLEKLINNGALLDIKDVRGKTALMHAISAGKKEAFLFLINKNESLIAIKDFDGRTPLMNAIINRNDGICKVLIEKGADVNAGDDSGQTPLMSAIERGLRDVCMALIAKGANVNEKDNSGRTPFMLAFNQSLRHVCIALIEKGAHVNVKDDSGRTPLMLALENGFSDVCTALIANGANVNEKDNQGLTPLILAAKWGLRDVCMALIAKDAGVNEKDNQDRTPLMLAAKWGLSDVCMALIAKDANVNAKDDSGRTPLMLAVEQGLSDVCIALIAKGADVNVKDDSGQTLLMLAAKQGLRDVCMVLIANDADVNANDNWGQTPLILAAHMGLSDVCLALIAKGANVNVKDDSGQTLLILAAKQGLRDVCMLLILKGADVNERDNQGRTPLMLAAERGLSDVCMELIVKGANVNEKDNFNRTPLMLAFQQGLSDVCMTLIVKGANVNEKDNQGRTPLMLATKQGLSDVLILAAEQGRSDVCMALIANGANVNGKDNQGRTPLILAAEQGLSDVCMALIKKGANVNEKDNQGRTPLMLAAERGLRDVCMALLERRANVNVKDNSDQTPLILAAKWGLSDVCRELIVKGANVNVKDNQDRTPLMLAVERGLSDVCMELILKGANVNVKDNQDRTPLMLAAQQDLKAVCLMLIEKGADVNAKDNRGRTPLMLALENDFRYICLRLIEKGANIDDGILGKIENHRDEAFKSDIKDSIARREEIKRKGPLSFTQKEKIQPENESPNVQPPKPGSK